MSFYNELKRRNVFRVAIAYLDLDSPDRASMLFNRSGNLVPDGLGANWGELLLRVFRIDAVGIEQSVDGILKFFGTGHWMGQFSVAQLRNKSIANALQRTGEWEKANDLLRQSHDFIRDRPRLGWLGGY